MMVKVYAINADLFKVEKSDAYSNSVLWAVFIISIFQNFVLKVEH